MSAPIVRAIRARADRVRFVRHGNPLYRSLESWDVDLDNGGEFSVLLGSENIAPLDGVPDYRWHLSIGGSSVERVPAWNEFVAIAHRVRPGVPFAIPLPPRSWWLNENEYVLHAWETHDANLVEHWRANPRPSEPT